jgi:hypothetical protein
MQPEEGTHLTGIDPGTGGIVPLFHPRKDSWVDHFRFQEAASPMGRIAVIGLTVVGPATARLLDMNEDWRQFMR